MQEHECYPDNSFSDSIPDVDVECGCVENYDLNDWNDTEPIDDENGSFNPVPIERPHGAPCLTECPFCPECEPICSIEYEENIAVNNKNETNTQPYIVNNESDDYNDYEIIDL